MQTKQFTAQNVDHLRQAARILQQDGLVAMPTETVYGLAANALSPTAVAKIFVAKGRPQDNPLIVHISELDQWAPLVKEIPPAAMALAKAYWPGPLTIILPRSPIVPDCVTGGLDTVAVRMPSHPVARELITLAGVPLAAPSANSSGLPSPTTAAHVTADMDGKIEAVLDGGSCSVGVESTVITMTTNPPRLLRPGGITPAQLEDVLGKITIDPAVKEQLAEGAVVASPGMKYKHYAPKAQLTMLKGSGEACARYVKEHATDGTAVLCFNEEEALFAPLPTVAYGAKDDTAQQAQLVFDALRQLDDMGVKEAFVRCPQAEGVGLAVYNRLLRSCAFRVIDLEGMQCE